MKEEFYNHDLVGNVKAVAWEAATGAARLDLVYGANRPLPYNFERLIEWPNSCASYN